MFVAEKALLLLVISLTAYAVISLHEKASKNGTSWDFVAV